MEDGYAKLQAEVTKLEHELRDHSFSLKVAQMEIERSTKTIESIGLLAREINGALIGDAAGRVGLLTTMSLLNEKVSVLDHQGSSALRVRVEALERLSWRNAGFATAVGLAVSVVWEMWKSNIKK